MESKAWRCGWMFTVLLGVIFLFSAHPVYSKSEPGEKNEQMQTGWIFHIDEKSITVDDRQFWFSPATLFLTKEGEKTGSYSFVKGDYVGFRLGEDRIITTLRVLNPHPGDMQPSVTSKRSSKSVETTSGGNSQPAGGGTSGSGMYLEDGVWKN